MNELTVIEPKPAEQQQYPKQLKPVAERYTGQILLTTRPKTYRKVVELLSQPIVSVNAIAQQCKVARHTIDAIRVREAADITQRKMELSNLISDIAHIGAARVADTIGKAKVRDAIIGTGVAIDKFIALNSSGPVIQIANVMMPSDADREERRSLHAKLDEISRQLNEPTPDM